jgi:hypothetical protein
MTLEQLWAVEAIAPVQPRPVCALTGLDEKLLRAYRQMPSRTVGRGISAIIMRTVTGPSETEAIRQWARMGGVVLWERELEQIANNIGV